LFFFSTYINLNYV